MRHLQLSDQTQRTPKVQCEMSINVSLLSIGNCPKNLKTLLLSSVGIKQPINSDQDCKYLDKGCLSKAI